MRKHIINILVGAISTGLLISVVWSMCLKPQEPLMDKSHFANAPAAVTCGMDSTLFIYDTRTYGIRYRRGWFDTLVIPFYAGQITSCTTLPFLYGTRPDSLWWWDGSQSILISPGGGGGSTLAANGLELKGDTVIMGYNSPVFRSVDQVLANNPVWGINYDSVDDLPTYGPFIGLDQVTPGGYQLQQGWNNSFTSWTNVMTIDSSGWDLSASGDSLNAQFQQLQNFSGLGYSGINQFQRGAGTISNFISWDGQLFQEDFSFFSEPFNYQTLYGNSWMLGSVGSNPSIPGDNQVAMSAAGTFQVLSYGSQQGANLALQTILLDSIGGGTHINYLNFDGDSIANELLPVGVTMGMPTSSVVTNGSYGCLTITFTTGTINPADTGTLVASISDNGNLATAYHSTFGSAKNKAMGFVMQSGGFYYVDYTGLRAYDVRASIGTVGSLFTSNTQYVVTFMDVGHGSENE